jgi:hypothetical protein
LKVDKYKICFGIKNTPQNNYVEMRHYLILSGVISSRYNDNEYRFDDAGNQIDSFAFIPKWLISSSSIAKSDSKEDIELETVWRLLLISLFVETIVNKSHF